METKITKAQAFTAIAEIVKASSVVPELKSYYVDILTREVDMIKSRTESRRSAAAKKKAAENEPIKKAIMAVLKNSTAYKRASDIREASPELTLLSTPKVSAVLKQMAESGEIYRELETGGSKKFYIYAMAQK